jgi:hypothetical protein
MSHAVRSADVLLAATPGRPVIPRRRRVRVLVAPIGLILLLLTVPLASGAYQRAMSVDLPFAGPSLDTYSLFVDTTSLRFTTTMRPRPGAPSGR